MKQNKIAAFFIILLLHFIIPFMALGQVNFKPVVIEGRVEASSIKNTISVSLQKEFIFHYLGVEKYKIECDKNGNFKWSFDTEHLAAITLYLNDTVLIFNNFYAEPEDSIFMMVTEDANTKRNVSFSGEGSENFRCMYALDSNRKRLFFEPPRLTMLNKIGDSVINSIASNFSSMIMHSDILYRVLYEYKNKMSPQIFELLYTDITGDLFNTKCSHLAYSLIAATPEQKTSISRIFFQDVYFLSDKIRDGIGVYSDNYIEYLFRRSQLKLKLRDESSTYSMKEMDSLLINDYSGIVRDRLLVRYLIGSNIGVSSEEYEYCLRRSLGKMETPIYKQYLDERLRKLSKGSPAYNFSLSDMNGKIVSLSDFKGKAVLLDFWFTGCSACGELSKEMDKSVIPKFKDSSVVFVSICLDKEREKWIKSVGTGKYTNEQSVNLFTDGLAFDHPLVKYYNIQGCPTLLLIDKEGRISSSNPHRDPVQLIEDIKRAIKSE